MSAVDLPIPEVRSPRRRSVSQLLSYSNCGEEYRLSRRTDAPQRPAGWLYHGTAVHDAIEAWEKSGRSMPEEELHTLYLTRYRTLVNERLETSPLSEWMTGGMKKPETDLTDREDVGWYQVQDYVQEALKAFELWEVVESELAFDILIGEVRVIGYIDQVVRDRLTGELHCVDIKTGAKVPASPVQLAIYRVALQTLYPDKPIADVFYWAHLGRPASKTGKTKPKPSKWVEEDLSDWPVERVAQWLKDMDRSEAAGIYLPSPGDGCRVCSVQQWCSAMSWHLPSVQQYAQEGAFDPVEVKVTPPDPEQKELDAIAHELHGTNEEAA